MRASALGLALLVPFGACHSSSAPRSGAEVAASTNAARPAAPPAVSASQIDAMIRSEWANEKTVPSAPVDDARFLRRVYIDTVGTIPPPEVVTSFALDVSADKRARMVETLLASPAYGEHWGTYWTDVLIGQTPEKEVDKATFQRWLAGRFAANVPWNQIATELLTAQGQNGEGGPRGAWAPGSASASAAPAASAPAPMTSAMADEPPNAPGGAPAGPVNPPVNWFVKYNNTPQDLAGSASRIFLGVQIQCAQCHDHKTEKWKQEDFRSFAASFMRTRVEVLDKGPTMGAIKRATVVDVGYPLFRYLKNPELVPLAKATPKALDGTDLSRTPNPRQALAAWMTSPDNTWFAEAFVNRMWGHYLGRGFVNPIDDLRPSNPATAPEVLDALSKDFVAHGYDVKRLVRAITSTEVYQLSSAPRPGARADKLWSRFRLEPLGPEELLNALMDATGVEGMLRNTRANVERIRAVLFAAYSYLFDVDEEFDQTDFEGTVSQALALLNGRLVGGGTSDLPGSALDRILVSPGSDADKVTALYLRTVSRRPSQEELDYFARYVNEPHSDPVTPDAPAASSSAPAPPANRPLLQRLLGKGPGKKKGPNGAEPDPLGRLEERDARNPNPKRRAYEDLFWELLNSSEFTFNH